MSETRLDLLNTLAGAADALAALVAATPAEALAAKPAPDKWSAAEVLAHLAETETVVSVRLRMILTADEPALAGFDPDAWAAVGDYAGWEPAESIALFRLLRAASVAMLGRLTEDQWQRAGVHSERGRVSVADIAAFAAWHDQRHLEQMQRAID